MIDWGLACGNAACTTCTNPTHLQQLDTQILPPKACADAIAPGPEGEPKEPGTIAYFYTSASAYLGWMVKTVTAA